MNNNYISYFGKILILVGIIVILIGLIFTFSFKIKIPFNLGKLPGDIYIKKNNFSFYFPITTSIIISIILTFIFYLFSKK